MSILTGHEIAADINCAECQHIRRPLAWHIQASQSAVRRTSVGHNRTECQRGCGDTCRRSVPKAADCPPDPPTVYFRATCRQNQDAVGRGCKTLLTWPVNTAPKEMTWPCYLRSCDGEVDRARGNDEILPCQGRCERRNKEGEGVYGRIRKDIAGGHASTLFRQSRSGQQLATSWTIRPWSRVMIRGDTTSCSRSPLPRPLIAVSAIV